MYIHKKLKIKNPEAYLIYCYVCTCLAGLLDEKINFFLLFLLALTYRRSYSSSRLVNVCYPEGKWSL